MTKIYFDTNRGPDALNTYLEYVRDLEDYIRTAFGDVANLRHNLLTQGTDYAPPDVREIYLQRFDSALNYQNQLIQ